MCVVTLQCNVVQLCVFFFQVIMIVMCTLTLCVHSIFQPYIKKRVNVIETLYLYILCVMATMQVLQKPYIANTVCLWLLIFTTLHAVLLTGYKAVGFFQRRCKRSCPRGCQHRQEYGSMGETQIERSLDAEQIKRKNIFDIIFSSPDDSESSFPKEGRDGVRKT